MPAKIDWLIPGQVIYQRWWGLGTLDDMRWANQKSLDMFAQYPDQPLIHCIANATGQEKIDAGLQQISQIYTALDHPQAGWVLLIDNNPLIRFMGNIALKIGRRGTRLRFINNMDEWKPFLKERDTMIDWDMINLSIIEEFEKEIQV